MQAILIQTTEAAYNLALEEVLFESLPQKSDGLFLLWQNSPSIIVGRHQCTAEEINPSFVEQHHLPVIRRSTGGGAVYHDLGNLNFSFIERVQDKTKASFAHYLKPICTALAELGVDATLNGRNDLEVQGYKISGSAQRFRDGKVLHHGTLLVALNFDNLTQALSVSPEKYLSKGVASVRSRVANIQRFWEKGCSMALLKQTLIKHCAREERVLSSEITQRAEILAQDKYRTWDWNFGVSPAFTFTKKQRFPWGLLDMRLDVRKGIIQEARLHGDFFSQEKIETLEQRFVGVRHESAALQEALQGVPLELFFVGSCREELLQFFVAP